MQGQMDHGLANARFNEQQENIAPILDALRKYGSDVAGRVSAFADDPAQALYGGFADTMGLNLDRPIEEYAEMARNPQAGEIDPNSPAVLEAMGWLPGPMGALGTITGKGKWYHGSRIGIDKNKGGPLWLTDSLEEAEKYARGGPVYEVSPNIEAVEASSRDMINGQFGNNDAIIRRMDTPAIGNIPASDTTYMGIRDLKLLDDSQIKLIDALRNKEFY